jgi:diguanylate cyclase (GGDEF)-like protein
MNYPTTFELPTTDALTELLTGPYFRHVLAEELLPQAEASGDPLTVLLLDVDGFLEANESLGREAGDALLQAVSRVIRDGLHENAVLSRHGGDEFAAALPDVRVDDAFTLAEGIRREVAALKVPQHPEAHVTASIGLAAYPSHGTRDVELLREVDQALYTAKTTGRNKVSLPLTDSRMVTKTSHYTATQLQRLADLARTVHRNEAGLLREALDDLFRKYDERMEAKSIGERG